MIRLAAWLLAICLTAGPVLGQDSQPPLKVAVFVNPPFVMHDPSQGADGGYSGFGIDLWEMAAAKLGRSFIYQPAETLIDLQQSVQDARADIGVVNLTITRNRLQRMDLTQPWFDAGLRVMVNENKHGGFTGLLASLADSGHLRVYGWIALIILAATIVLTVVDRRLDQEFPREWHLGLAESFYHVMSVATTGKASHKQLFGWVGKLLAALWMISGVAVLAYVTSSVASVMTAKALTTEISGFGDLPGKRVGVLGGSYAEQFCRDAALPTQGYDNLEAAVNALVGGRIQAIVGDDPVLEYFDKSHPELPVTEVGAIFQSEKYGFALPPGSRLTREMDLQILAAQESGWLRKLRVKYFGAVP